LSSYSFDPRKSERNLLLRGFDFSWVVDFEWDRALISQDKRQDYPENRFQALEWIGKHLHMLIFTPRDGVIHVISLRRANQRERNLHAAQTKP
jgi:uncharacterized DUF497 family protein